MLLLLIVSVLGAPIRCWVEAVIYVSVVVLIEHDDGVHCAMVTIMPMLMWIYSVVALLLELRVEFGLSLTNLPPLLGMLMLAWRLLMFLECVIEEA